MTKSQARRQSRTPAQINAEANLVLAQRRRESAQGFWRSVAVAVPSLCKYGCIAWVASQAATVLIAWTGNDTNANIQLKVLFDFLSENWVGTLLPWLLAGSLWLLYHKEKRLKEATLAKLGEVNAKYERLTDPGRSSSLLPPSGQTHPRDLP